MVTQRIYFRFTLGFLALLCATLWGSRLVLVAQTVEPSPPIHIVQPGETLGEIAEQYDLTEEELKALNDLQETDFIFVGEQLLLASQPEVSTNSSIIHTIRAGETLSEIAKTYGLSQGEVMRLNGISDANQIYIGQTLLLPASPPAAKPEPTADSQQTTASPEPSADPVIDEGPLLPAIAYTVKRGETLSEIAKAAGFALQDIMALNGLDDPDAIYAGQALLLPPESSLPTPTDVATEIPEEAAIEPAGTATPSVTPPSTPAPPALTKEPTITHTPVEPPVQHFAESNLSMSLNQSYTVKSGDTVNQIVLRTGVDLDALLAINRLTELDISTLVPGQNLILPATAQDIMARPTVVIEEEQVDPDSSLYEVLPGDNLSTIAKEHSVSTVALMTANGIINPDSIFVGQRLTIPPTPIPSLVENNADGVADGEPKSAADQSQPVQPPSMRRGYFYYTVGTGDTLGQIAARFDTTPMALIDYNGLPNTDTVYLGLELRIPYGPPIIPVRLPPSPGSGSRFVVSISRQECWLFRGNYVAHAWRCSTGYGEWTTRLGTFHIKTKIEMAKSGAYELDMPYWLGIYDVGSYENGIHGLPVRWRTGEKIWSELIGKPATFGCAMLDDPDAELLFNTAYLGMPVHIVQ